MLNKNKECMYYIEYHYLVYHSSILDTVFTMIIPSLLIIVINVLIIVKVWRFLQSKWRTPDPRETVGMTTADNQTCHDRRGYNECTSCEGNAPERLALEPLRLNQDYVHTSRGYQVVIRRSSQLQSQNVLCCHCFCVQNCFLSACYTTSYDVRRTSYSSSTSRTAQNRSRQRSQTTQIRTTRTLLIISSLFVVFNLPSQTFRVWVTLYPPSGIPSEQLLLGQLVFQFLYYINFSSNLFMYCACSQLFRKELKTLLQRLGYKISACWGNMIDCIKSCFPCTTR